MNINEAMKLLEDAGIDYMSVMLKSDGDYGVILSFVGLVDNNRVGSGKTPSEAFDDAISRIHTNI